MTFFQKSTTSLGLALMMSVPSGAMAQATCSVNLNTSAYPCTMPFGVVVENRLQGLQARVERQEQRLAELDRLLAQADKDVTLNEASLAEERDIVSQRLVVNREAVAVEQERVQADQQAQQQAAEAEPTKEQLKAERRAAKARDKAARRKALQSAVQATGTEQGESGVPLVETELLTREDVRASDQEFDTAVAGAGREAKSDSDGGLSKFEKALLLGLGAVAVGKILDNGDEVVSRSGDRVVVERGGELRVLKNDDALLRRPGNDVRTETFDDGSTRTIVTKPDGTRIVTIRGADGTVLRRVRVLANGEEITLFDDTRQEREIIISELPQRLQQGRMAGLSSEAELRRALEAQSAAREGEAYSLRQVRDIREVRMLAPEVQLDAVRFASGSAAIEPAQARSLARIGNTLRDMIARDPRTVLLVEGHTDAVGDATYNLALSDRRAETVALALTEYFGVPAENMIVQGYGESYLKVPTLAAEQANRRAVVRNITGLLR